MRLDDDEVELAMVALSQALQPGSPVDQHTGCGGFVWRKMKALFDRLDQHQKDQAEEQADVGR